MDTQIELISGAFEVHLIVPPEQENALFMFAKNLSDFTSRPIVDMMDCRITIAQSLYGNHPRQPMLTFYLSGNVPSVRERVDKLVDFMRNRDFTVLRTKIESILSNKNVPDTVTGEKHYVEFHYRVPVKSGKDWNHLAELCATHGAHLFYNPKSKTSFVDPVVTLRRYNIDVAQARAEHLQLFSEIAAAGFIPNPEVQAEFSVYDSAVELDAGWLFSDPAHPDLFLEAVPVKFPTL